MNINYEKLEEPTLEELELQSKKLKSQIKEMKLQSKNPQDFFNSLGLHFRQQWAELNSFKISTELLKRAWE